MLFANNHLFLERCRSDRAHDVYEPVLRFNAVDALEAVRPAPAEPVQVRDASTWQQQESRVVRTPLLVSTDWTFTTTYAGTLIGRLPPDRWRNVPVADGLPISELQRQDLPVAFYTELVLFEDELDDQGVSRYTVKLRVMRDAFWYLLARFWLRVDNMLVRIYDTRYFHRFGTTWLVREVQRREAPMEVVQKAVVSHWSDSMMSVSPQAGGGTGSHLHRSNTGVQADPSSIMETTTHWRAAYHCTDEDRIQEYLPVVEHHAEVLDLGL
ncbi:hypothetical protein CCYA_CCYA09G2646 [Cyanidiococcus yangmingshanensis]|nr:hypothetical protein CCYA_CCYA09G2646 [Cyanidiococcus yangmingshanensis]